ncbi:hypothetical protein TIFTF001_020971 [Ficus carica]|uniref:Uncharacterized protein n=1 Tax=Ficus carica TaxID=3494 RepID=A0AA88AUJ7_FICCA|nr:hypothetical protein TIFTF001_020971 [Ficus carica]
MVVRSWAPQVAVLRKEAEGGFVTHCRWNSVLEAIVAGVPMVAWPLYAEQHMNRNVMVKDLRIAVAVEERERDGSVSGDEVEREVRELMESEHGREIRHESLKMKNMASAALGESGSFFCCGTTKVYWLPSYHSLMCFLVLFLSYLFLSTCHARATYVC